jgi:hypothetical protein
MTVGANSTIDGSARLDAVQSAVFPSGIPSVLPPAKAVAAANFRNLLDGGDFTINPFQRNIPGLASANVLSAAITSTVGYFADRWFGVGGASSAILFAKDSDASVPGFGTALRFQRQSANANTAPLNCGQVLETLDSIRLQGLPVVFSGFLYAGANYSGGNVTIQVISGTGTDQSAANMVAGSWTGQTVVATLAFTPTNAAQPFVLTGTVPINATQIGVLFTWTPTGTAGSNDFVRLLGLQLELGTSPSNFEHRDIEVELALCQRYALIIAEAAAGVSQGAGGVATATNVVNFTITLPTPMRAAPTVSVTVGTFKAHLGAAAVAATGLTANATHTPVVVGLNCTATATAGQGAILEGGGGSGFIVVSADL